MVSMTTPWEELFGDITVRSQSLIDRQVEGPRVDTAELFVVTAVYRVCGKASVSGYGQNSDLRMAFRDAIRLLPTCGADSAVCEIVVARRTGIVDLRSASGWRRACGQIQRGLIGIRCTVSGDESLAEFVSPTTAIASNRRFEKWVAELAKRHCLSLEEARDGGVTCEEFAAVQLLARFDEGQATTESLYRGNRVTELDMINDDSVSELEQLLSEYLIRSVQPDGRMVYLYYPSRGTEDLSRNNAIRQWMALVALCRIHARRGDDSLLPVIERNITYNLRTMYSVDNGFGIIDDRGNVKLGAVALAALALMESPFADRYRDPIQKLLSTLTLLWQDSGEFRTFYRPSWRTEFQNFYSGEALLAWATVLSRQGDATLSERFLRSFRHYRQWHLNPQNRNPAFVPWHTQAYFLMWQKTGNPMLRDFIFEMNDWLLDIQQWDDAPTPDTRGRFYDPNRPFGPPHASSTGVYLEGLVDAFALARHVEEHERADAYRVAILRGLRSVHQLTFKDDVDMFYVSKRDRLRGGVRTTVYNNVVRVDNVQHNLMAIQKVAERFSAADFR